MKKIALVTTTIFIPKLLSEYAKNFKKFGWKDVLFVIAGDEKTPKDIVNFCDKLQMKFGFEVKYLDIKSQEELTPKLAEYIPHNSLSRRNFGMLFAWKMGVDIIITIDDDNFVRDDDYLKYHSIVGEIKKLKCISTDRGWYNVCEVLKEERGRYFFHRGFPLDQRSFDTKLTIARKKCKIIVNEGLWIDSPDVDAIALLNYGKLKVVDFDSSIFGNNFALDKGTWCPINTQNTAIAREALPSFFLNPSQMRYDDIWASFILRKVADHLDHYVSYGQPITIHKRNVHNYLKDLEKELDGMKRTPELIKELRSIEISGKSYFDCTYELIEKLSNNFRDIKKGYLTWLKTLEENG
jgi:hypothetical protein